MNKKRITCSEVFLIVAYISAIILYEVLGHFSVFPENSLVGVFLFFLIIIGITIVYLMFVQKETFVSIVYHTKTFLPYLVLPFLVGFFIIAALPFFISTKTKAFNLIVLLVVFGSAICSLEIKRRLSKRKNENKIRQRGINSDS